MSVRLRQFYLAVILFGISVSAYCGQLKVVIIDTGVDRSIPELNEVFCPSNEHLDATTGLKGIAPDLEGHGTHIAGIIRALAGREGYCLSICKFYLESNPGRVNLENTVKCLKFAKDIGASYINYSAGGAEFSEDEQAAILDSGAMMITASGNDGRDLDRSNYHYYPASYHLPNVTVVGSTDNQGVKCPTSNYGSKTVNRWALGEMVYSAGRYMSGTSQATAVVTGTTLRRRFKLPDIEKVESFLFRFWRP